MDNLHADGRTVSPTHAFVVRIWQEPGLTRSNGSLLWRGQVQHAASGRSLVFQSLDEMLRFIQSQADILEERGSAERE